MFKLFVTSVFIAILINLGIQTYGPQPPKRPHAWHRSSVDRAVDQSPGLMGYKAVFKETAWQMGSSSLVVMEEQLELFVRCELQTSPGSIHEAVRWLIGQEVSMLTFSHEARLVTGLLDCSMASANLRNATQCYTDAIKATEQGLVDRHIDRIRQTGFCDFYLFYECLKEELGTRLIIKEEEVYPPRN